MVRLRAWRCSFTSESLSNFPDDLAFHVPLINRGALTLLAEALSTRLNRDKKKEAPASFFLNASLVLDSPFGTYRKARPAPQGEGLRLGPSGNRRVPLPRSL